MEVEKGSGAGISLDVNKVVYSEVTPGEADPEKGEQGSSAVASVSKCGGSELPSRGSNVPKRKVPKRQITRKDISSAPGVEDQSDRPQIPFKKSTGLQLRGQKSKLSEKGHQFQILCVPQTEIASCADVPSKDTDVDGDVNTPQPDGAVDEQVCCAHKNITESPLVLHIETKGGK